MTDLFYPNPLVRIPLYMSLGLISEVLFTGIMDLVNPMFLQSWNAKSLDHHRPNNIRRDPRAMGYTFLWMIPLYSTLILIEPLSQWMRETPIVIRGMVYVAVFWFFEYVGGTVIKKMTGYDPWDYSYSRFSLHGHIRWDFAPVWFIFSLIVEWFSIKFVQITPAFKQVFG